MVESSPRPNDIIVTETSPPRALLIFLSGLHFAVFLRVLFKTYNIPIPFRLLILTTGAVIGLITIMIGYGGSYRVIVHIPPRYVLMGCMPILLFKEAFSIDTHVFVRSWGQIFFLAIPGVLINASFIGMIMMVLLDAAKWTYSMGFLFGAICSSIYPMEIVSILKEIGQAKHLSILLQGESMIGDGSVVIMYELLTGIIHEVITSWYQVVADFARFALGSIAFGFLLGKLTKWIMSAMYNDVVNLLVFTVVAAYLTYYIAVEMLSISGVIAVVVLGISVGIERTSLSADMEARLLQFWDMLTYITNTIVFLLAGVITVDGIFQTSNPQNYAFVLVTYVISIVSRFIEYLLLAPITSRLGYGLTFKKMTIAVWGGLRGALPFCLTLTFLYDEKLSSFGRILLLHIVGLIILTLLINGTTMPIFLKLLGVSELSIPRKINMNNCMRYLLNRRERTIAMLKMDRFLADANWQLVNSGTLLNHPYKINFDDTEDEEDNYLVFRTATCPDCQREIPNEPTHKEMVEMTREARMRILKAKKVSYTRQYENGMLSKEGIRVLTQAVEVAMDTSKALIELDGLHRYFRREGFMHYVRRKFLGVFFTKSENQIKPPRKFWRRVCFHIVNHSAFDYFIYSTIMLNVIPISMEIHLMPEPGSKLSIGLKIANTYFFVVYFVEFVLKIYAYSWIYIFQHGFKTYFRSYWNIFDFCILCACAVDLALDYTELLSETFIKLENTVSKVTLIIKLVRIIRLVRLLRLCKAWYPKLIKYCDSKIDKHLVFAYDVGKGFVAGEEEVSSILIQMIDNNVIREECRLRMEADRLAITKELALVQKDRPWIAVTVKTRQAARATLNSMADALLELKVSGWVDDFEYGMLTESLEERLKYVRTKIKSVQPSPPQALFKEVPWMADDEQISEFLFENVKMKIFDQGDIICADGGMSYGVYILVTGLLKLKYVPKKQTLNGLAEYGRLPIIDYISSTRFDEGFEDYIVPGNCIGELSVLTGRPYDCTITADTAGQVYILTHDTLKKAFLKNTDILNGLESKMWKCISVRLATSILMDTPIYQSTNQDKIRYHLERSFVPDLSSYKIFGVNDMMEDIILVEGVAFDYNTRDCYTAPCYIPRTVQKIILPKSSRMNIDVTIETKLLIVPAIDADEFDIMEKEQQISELVSTVSVKCLQHTIQSRAAARKRKKRQTTFGMGYRRVRYSGSRTSESTYHSRSRTTETSLMERELENINMSDAETISYRSQIQQRSNRQPSDGNTPTHFTTEESNNLESVLPVNQANLPEKEDHKKISLTPGQEALTPKRSSIKDLWERTQSLKNLKGTRRVFGDTNVVQGHRLTLDDTLQTDYMHNSKDNGATNTKIEYNRRKSTFKSQEGSKGLKENRRYSKKPEENNRNVSLTKSSPIADPAVSEELESLTDRNRTQSGSSNKKGGQDLN